MRIRILAVFLQRIKTRTSRGFPSLCPGDFNQSRRQSASNHPIAAVSKKQVTFVGDGLKLPPNQDQVSQEMLAPELM